MGVDVENGELDLKVLGGEPTYLRGDGYPTTHGTKIAGLITAATNNEEGIASLAPRAIILPMKMKVVGLAGDSPLTPLSSAVLAVRSLRFELGKGQWAFDVPIANCCFSNNGTPYWVPRTKALGYNITRDSKVNRRMYIASAGNDGEETKKYPAAYERVLSVTGLTAVLERDVQQGLYFDLDSTLHVSTFGYCSNYYDDEEVYPVSGIYYCRVNPSSVSRGYSTCTYQDSDGDYYDHFGGTSAAVPCVTALAFHLYDAKPTVDWRDVYERIVETRNDSYAIQNPPIAGLVDYQAALNGWN